MELIINWFVVVVNSKRFADTVREHAWAGSGSIRCGSRTRSPAIYYLASNWTCCCRRRRRRILYIPLSSLAMSQAPPIVQLEPLCCRSMPCMHFTVYRARMHAMHAAHE